MRADVIVIGLGAMGSAALYQLARRGIKAIGIDRFDPPHNQGSSHGETRVTRCAVGEGSAYAPLVLRSHEIWKELEVESDEQLLLECGFLAIDGAGNETPFHGKPGFFDETVAVARTFDIAHEELDVAEAGYRFPQFRLAGHERVYFEPGGGLVFPERCLAAQLSAARRLGAQTVPNETVQSVEPSPGAVRVVTDRGQYEADRVVVSAGGWSLGLLPELLSPMRIYRQVLHWYDAAEPAQFDAARSPTFIWNHGPTPADSFYGFPIVAGLTPGVKVAGEDYDNALPRPEAMDRAVADAEVSAMFDHHVAGRLVGVSDRSVKAACCFYTFAPQGEFLIDRHPGDDRIVVVSACSGHGFKHSGGVGDHVAALISGEAASVDAFSFAGLAARSAQGG